MIERKVPGATGSRNVGQATIRLLFLSAFFEALSDPGARLEPLMREHGFFWSQMDNPYERAPLHRYVSLVEQASEKLKRPFLGLEIGSHFGLSELGPFQALLRSAGTLRSALATLSLFQSRWQTRTLLDAVIDADHTTYSYRIEDDRIWPRRQDAEFTMAGFTTLIRDLTSAKWSPTQVHFEHSIVDRGDRLQQFFRGRVLGNQVANQLCILNEDLDRPFANAVPAEDSKLKLILERHLLDLMGPEATLVKDFVAQAEEVVTRRLGRTHVDCDSIAGELNLSGRSFRRRLMEQGTSFRTILQSARHARARVILEGSNVPLSTAAEQLGYSDTATFSRAFKDWTGESPGRYAKHAPDVSSGPTIP